MIVEYSEWVFRQLGCDLESKLRKVFSCEVLSGSESLLTLITACRPLVATFIKCVAFAYGRFIFVSYSY